MPAKFLKSGREDIVSLAVVWIQVEPLSGETLGLGRAPRLQVLQRELDLLLQRGLVPISRRYCAMCRIAACGCLSSS